MWSYVSQIPTHLPLSQSLSLQLTSVKGVTPVKVELRINGRYEIELSAENELERVMLSEMSERANKGQPISFATAEENCCRVGVDK